MIRVGVTGGIGSGKSTVCELFGRLGIPVYDCDRRARELMGGRPTVGKIDIEDSPSTGNPLRTAIIDLLGAEAYPGSEPDRAFIAGRVFADPKLLASLDAIIHPAVAEDFEAWAVAMAEVNPQTPTDSGPGTSAPKQTPPPYIIMESAILFESRFDRFVDKVIAVSAPRSVRLERVMARGGISPEDAMRRIDNQMSDDERNSLADYTIDNAGGLDELAARVRQIDKLLKL